MDWQESAALVIVASTAGFFLWNALRTRKFAFQKKNTCGCSGGAHARQGSVMVTGRKGQRAHVIFRAN
jgi:hypothetical protein